MDGIKKLWKPYFAIIFISSLFYMDAYLVLSGIPYGKELFELRSCYKQTQISPTIAVAINIIIFSLFSNLNILKKVLHMFLAYILQFLVIVSFEIFLFPGSLT